MRFPILCRKIHSCLYGCLIAQSTGQAGILTCGLKAISNVPPNYQVPALSLVQCLQAKAQDQHLLPVLAAANPATLFFEEFPQARVEKLINFRKYMYPANFLGVLFLSMQATLTLLGEEKEKGIKDALLLKGMRRSAYWISWFISQSAVMTASTVVVTVSARFFSIIQHTSMLHFGSVLWVYGNCLICMAFLLSSCFKSSKAMFVAAIILLIFITAIAYVVELLMIRLNASYFAVLATFLFAPIPYGHCEHGPTLLAPVFKVLTLAPLLRSALASLQRRADGYRLD